MLNIIISSGPTSVQIYVIWRFVLPIREHLSQFQSESAESRVSHYSLSQRVSRQQQISAAAPQCACLCPSQALYLCWGTPEFAGASSATHTHIYAHARTHTHSHTPQSALAVRLDQLPYCPDGATPAAVCHIETTGQKSLYSLWRKRPGASSNHRGPALWSPGTHLCCWKVSWRNFCCVLLQHFLMKVWWVYIHSCRAEPLNHSVGPLPETVH